MSDLNEVKVSGLDSEELNELLKYITGESSTVPDALQALTTNLYQKIMTSSGYAVANDTMRQAKIARYLAKIEEELFDEDLLKAMSHEDLMEMYKTVSAENSKALENSRKWLQQNRDAFTAKQTEIEKMAAQLSTLSPSKLEAVRSILAGESLMSSDETISQLDEI